MLDQEVEKQGLNKSDVVIGVFLFFQIILCGSKICFIDKLVKCAVLNPTLEQNIILQNWQKEETFILISCIFSPVIIDSNYCVYDDQVTRCFHISLLLFPAAGATTISL